MTTEDRFRAGDTLGRYELLKCVGRGGMATVWAARHHGAHGFSKIVAVKTMLPQLSDDVDFQRMFLTEARVAARIRHPNVVETLDLGEADGALYIVMEWIDGETLSAVMKSAFARGGVPLPISLALIAGACAGAHAAHELCDDDNRSVGLVHRDVSPPNVLISYSGVVKLADFGVAKTLDVNNSVTLAGQIKGKMRYMSPEQLLGGVVDRRTDVFALGINLYQLTTGRHPWFGDTATVTMQKILTDAPVAPTSLVDGYPPELERIVLKALARNPAERFETAAEMGWALEELARRSNAVATPRQVAEYLAELLGPHGTKRREGLRSAIREVDARVRGAALQLQKIDESWDAELLPAPPELAPTPPVQMAEIVTLRPVSARDSTPPLLREGSSLLSRRFTRLVALSKSRRSKNTLLLGAALVLLSAAYALGGHRTPEQTAAASTTSAPGTAETAETTARECGAVKVTALPRASLDSASTSTAPKEVRRLPPPPPAKRIAAAPKPASQTPDSDPDVGF
jgi:serine/threonine protein kinase